MTNDELRQLFNGFVGREEALRKILRYHSRQKVMFYRTNDWIHAKKVYWLTDDLAPRAQAVFGDKYNPELARMLALVHDDLEIVIGDIQAGDKAKMTSEQKSALKQKEWEAIQQLIERFPKKIGDYQYGDLLECAWKETALEAQLMKLADKFDSYGEAMHEILAGNSIFTVRFNSPFGVNPAPVEYYIDYFKKFPASHQDLKPLLDLNHPLFIPLPTMDLNATAKKGRPHTRESLYQNTDLLAYDYWKQTILKNASADEIADLYTQKEFL